MSRPRVPVPQLVRWVIAATVVGNAAYAASVFLIPRPPSGFIGVWDGWLLNIAGTLPAVLCALRARAERRHRGAWVAMALGIVANSVANLVFSYHDQLQDPVPFPAWSDLFFLLSYAAFAVAVVTTTQANIAGVTRAMRIDGLVVGLSAGSVAVALWFESILEQTGSTASVLVGLAYPLFDAVLIVVVVAGLVPLRFRPSPSIATLMLGITAFTWGDVVYLNQVADDSYVYGTALELTWVFGIVCLGVAAWLPATPRRAQPARSVAMTAVPAISGVTALVVIGFGIAGRIPVLASALAMAALGAALLRVAATVGELRRANEAFSEARTDDLTGLLNRRGFAEQLDLTLAGATRGVTVMVADLDGFKEVNDSLGHQAGDHLLTIVANRFRQALPAGSVAARLGGDEFGVLVHGSDADAEAVADVLSGALRDPIALDGLAVRIGASIGLASYGRHGDSRLELLRAADVAMYDAKQHHRDTTWYSAEHDPHSRDRLELIEDLRVAIEQRTLEMHYQPSIEVSTGQVVGMEALVRWHHPERGMVPPDVFIPLAERVGLIPAITRAALDISLEHLAAMLRAGQRLGLSVNISAVDLVDDELPAYVEQVLVAYQVPAELLTLEITETALSSDEVRAARTLDALRKLGVRISIDDFGVGYSSMSQLLKLPVDELKIDRSFIANIDDDLRAQAILSATVELGRTLGLAVVAEGIETPSALDAVTERGVDTAQGYYFSKALTSARFHRFVTKSVIDVPETRV